MKNNNSNDTVHYGYNTELNYYDFYPHSDRECMLNIKDKAGCLWIDDDTDIDAVMAEAAKKAKIGGYVIYIFNDNGDWVDIIDFTKGWDAIDMLDGYTDKEVRDIIGEIPFFTSSRPIDDGKKHSARCIRYNFEGFFKDADEAARELFKPHIRKYGLYSLDSDWSDCYTKMELLLDKLDKNQSITMAAFVRSVYGRNYGRRHYDELCNDCETGEILKAMQDYADDNCGTYFRIFDEWMAEGYEHTKRFENVVNSNGGLINKNYYDTVREAVRLWLYDQLKGGYQTLRDAIEYVTEYFSDENTNKNKER